MSNDNTSVKIVKGVKVYSGINNKTPFNKGLFSECEPNEYNDNIQFAFHSNIGSITVLDRMTGFGFRDKETGFRSADGEFWLASGEYDRQGVTNE
jgi:hypothetical protein